ncbi:MAG: hypothetical protein WDO73_34070 [Ignavibacteriota bacterium]
MATCTSGSSRHGADSQNPGPRPTDAGLRCPDYSEGLKVGYKWFDAEKKEPLFAFGHGLSYTTYAYSNLKAGLDSVTFTVRNTGKRAGAEIAQVYAGLPASAQEPPKRLVAWIAFRWSGRIENRHLADRPQSFSPSLMKRRTAGNCCRANTSSRGRIVAVHAAHRQCEALTAVVTAACRA